MPPVVAAAGIAGAASIVGGVMGSRSASGAARTQADVAQRNLDEQRRIYEIESRKEERDYADKQAERARQIANEERDRQKSLADEQRVIGSRQNAFGGFGGDLATFSKGYAPAYGMSAGQSQAIMDARNAGYSGGGRAPVAPDRGQAVSAALQGPSAFGTKGLGPGPGPMNPQGPQVTPGGGSGPALPGLGQSSAFGSTVWLQAPTGETTEVALQDAPTITKMIQAGAVIIPAPSEARA